MTYFHRAHAIGLWLLLSLAGILWLSWGKLNSLDNVFYQETSITLRTLSEKAAQHEAVLTTLRATHQTDVLPNLLPQLQTALPQLIAIGRWKNGQWQGTSASPPPQLYTQAQLQKNIAMGIEERQRYWLQSASGWALLIDLHKLLGPDEWLPSLSNIALQLDQRSFPLLQRQPERPAISWHLEHQKIMQNVSQPFILHSDKFVGIENLPWKNSLLWSALSAILIAILYNLKQARTTAHRERERNRLASMARLNTMGEMTAGIAHELNQPLAAIIANLGAAERMLDDEHEHEQKHPTVRHALRTSVEQAKRAADIIKRLRRMVEQRANIACSALDPNALISTLIFLRQHDLAQQHITLSWHNLSPQQRPIAERVALEQILHNLVQNAADSLQNAIEKTPQKSPLHIRISGESVGEIYRFSICDNGSGIPTELLPRLFEPFFTTRNNGMGLGLSLCQSLAMTMDGQLTVRNNSHADGVTAELTLPLALP
ncbi:MAG: ATP-binding protein [Glaciimonas sp.]|nr:ATP-binding protein [Glaciimonas sp.]